MPLVRVRGGVRPRLGLAALVAGLLLAAAPVWAQAGVVAGRVVEAETGAPLPGASVRLTGTSLGAASGPDGGFRIGDVPPGAYTVEATSVGFARDAAPVTVAPGARVEVTLRLAEAVLEAGEVVVAAARSQTATKTDEDVRLIPQSIAVVPARLLDAQQVTDVAEALRTVPGVAVAGRTYPFANLTLRGFAAENTSTFRRNGVEFAYFYDPLHANVERVEVLRGPASVLYGRIEPGGVVNLVTERPLARPRTEAEVEVSSWGTDVFTADVTGPLVGRTLLARVNASAERSGSWRDEMEARGTFLAPVVTWTPRPALRLTLEGEWETARSRLDPGLALADTTGSLTGVPDADDRATFYGEPAAAYDWRSRFAMLTAEAALGRGWALRATASLGRYAYEREIVQLVWYDRPTDDVLRQFRVETSKYRYLQGEAVLTGGVRTGPLRHALTLGLEANRLGISASNRAPLVTDGPTQTFFALAPVAYGAPVATGLPGIGETVEYVFADGQGYNLGAYVQERATLGVGAGRLHLLASARLSRVTAEAEWFALTATPESPVGLNNRTVGITTVTPGFGAVYEPVGWLSLYTSYGRSFNPIFQQVQESGEPFEPTRGEQVEAGLKAETRRLRASVALFQLDKQGALSQLPTGFYVQTGDQRSCGVEADVLAEPVEGLTVAGAYTFTQATVTEDALIPTGNVLPGAPRHSASLWADYRLSGGPLAGLGVGAGVQAVGRRYATLQNTLVLPAYTVVDFTASYRVGPRAELQVGLRNAFDVRYYEGAVREPDIGTGPALIIGWPAAPRSVRVRLTARM